MARFAPVVPIEFARALQDSPNEFTNPMLEDLLGSYHLLLAHDVVADPLGYKEVYNEVRDFYGRDSFIIMDNSVVELGTAVNLQMLLQACEIVRPDCLVVPDVMSDGAGTRERIQSFMTEWLAMKHSSGAPKYLPPLMGVIQGRDVGDCILTYYVMRNFVDIQYVAVPRIIAQKQGSRMPVLQKLAGMSELHENIHLLGFSDNLLDDVSCARMPCVMGIDSAVPIRTALKQIQLVDWLGYGGDKDYCGPRGDYWQRAFPASPNVRATMIKNLRDMRHWINIKGNGNI